MLRVGVQRVFGAAFVQRRFTTTPSTPPLPLADQEKVPVAIKYHDAATWPKDFTETDIKELLKDHVVAGTEIPYVSLAKLIEHGDVKSCNHLLEKNGLVPFTEIDVEEHLGKHVPNTGKDAKMKLQEREDFLAHLDRALSPTPGSEKRNVAFSYSQRGCGKTQFLKHFVATRRKEAMQCGRVIVRCCDIAKNETWFTWTLENQNTATPVTTNHSTNDGLCELVRMHVASVTGSSQDQAKYCDPKTAYETWISETAF